MKYSINDLSLREKMRHRSQFIQAIHSWMQSYDFVMVPTPTLVVNPGSEPSLDYFSTDLIVGSTVRKLFLPTSPEIHLKKALALGVGDCYEIKSVFRNGEITDHHQPEFQMLEFYKTKIEFAAFQNLVLNFILDLKKMFVDSGQIKGERSVAEVALMRHDLAVVPECTSAFVKYSVAELFQKFVGFELRPDMTLTDYKVMAESKGLKSPMGQVANSQTSWQIDDYFFWLWLEFIEPHLNPDIITVVHSYPAFQAALATVGSEGWADRFEIYWKGLELGNAFHELRDPDIQRQRLLDDSQKRALQGRGVAPIDEEFLSLLPTMPPCCGIAIGVERLYMALFDIDKISDCRLFSIGPGFLKHPWS